MWEISFSKETDPREIKILGSHKNLYMSVYRSSTQNDQKPEPAQQPSMNEWTHKLRYSYTMEQYQQ